MGTVMSNEIITFLGKVRRFFGGMGIRCEDFFDILILYKIWS